MGTAQFLQLTYLKQKINYEKIFFSTTGNNIASFL